MNIGDYVKIDDGIDGIVISNRKKNYRNDTVYLVLYFSEYNFGYKWKPISKDISEHRLKRCNTEDINGELLQAFNFVHEIVRYRCDVPELRIYNIPVILYYSSYGRYLKKKLLRHLNEDVPFPDTRYKSKCLPGYVAYYRDISKNIYKVRL